MAREAIHFVFIVATMPKAFCLYSICASDAVNADLSTALKCLASGRKSIKRSNTIEPKR